MPVSATIQTDVKYTSDGKNVWWPIPFPYTSFADVGVKVIDTATGLETALTLGKDYQIQGKHVVAVVPSGKVLQIWLTTSLDAVLATLPDGSFPGGMPPAMFPAPVSAAAHPAPLPPIHPVPPMGDPWVDRHLGVLSADLLNVKRQLEEGLAIERARECDHQIQRIKETGTVEIQRMDSAADVKLQASLATMHTTSQTHVDRINSIGTAISTSAQELANTATETARKATCATKALDDKIVEVRAEIISCDTRVDEALAAAAEAKQYMKGAATSASDAEVIKAACAAYQGQMDADIQLVQQAKAAVAVDRDAVTLMKNQAAEAATQATQTAEVVAGMVDAAQTAAHSAQTQAQTATTAATEAQDARDLAVSLAAEAGAKARESAEHAEAAARFAHDAEDAATATDADKRATAEDRAYVESIKDDAAQAVHDVAVEMLVPGVVQDAANAAALQATAQATQAAAQAVVAQRASEAAQVIAESARDTAQAQASSATTQANLALTRARNASSFADRADAAATQAESEADRAAMEAARAQNALTDLESREAKAAGEFFRLSDRETRVELALLRAGIVVDFPAIPPLPPQPEPEPGPEPAPEPEPDPLDKVPRMHVVTSLAEREALSGLKAGDQCFVQDASADPTVNSGAAFYIYQGTADGWVKVSESESMDNDLYMDTLPESIPENLPEGGRISVVTDTIGN